MAGSLPAVLQVDQWLQSLAVSQDERLVRLAKVEQRLRASDLPEDKQHLKAVVAWRLRQQLQPYQQVRPAVPKV